MAAREGLEPPTFALGKRCSILLSYRAWPGGAMPRAAAGAKSGKADDLSAPGGRRRPATIRDARRIPLQAAALRAARAALVASYRARVML